MLCGVVVEREMMLPILLDLLDSSTDMQMKPLTGLLRNLARNAANKEHMGRLVLFVWELLSRSRTVILSVFMEPHKTCAVWICCVPASWGAT